MPQVNEISWLFILSNIFILMLFLFISVSVFTSISFFSIMCSKLNSLKFSGII